MPRHGGGPVQRPLDRAERIAGNAADDRLELVGLKETDAAMGGA